MKLALIAEVQPILSKETVLPLSAMLEEYILFLIKLFLKNILNFNHERHNVSSFIRIFAIELQI